MSTEVSEIVLPKPKRKYLKKVRSNPELDAKIVTRTLQGLSHKEIANGLQVAPGNVLRRLAYFKPLFSELKEVHQFRAAHTEILDAAQFRFLKNMIEKADTATLRENTYAFDKVSHYGRLAAGLSTANISTKISYTGPDIKGAKD